MLSSNCDSRIWVIHKCLGYFLFLKHGGSCDWWKIDPRLFHTHETLRRLTSSVCVWTTDVWTRKGIRHPRLSTTSFIYVVKNIIVPYRQAFSRQLARMCVPVTRSVWTATKLEPGENLPVSCGCPREKQIGRCGDVLQFAVAAMKVTGRFAKRLLCEGRINMQCFFFFFFLVMQSWSF